MEGIVTTTVVILEESIKMKEKVGIVITYLCFGFLMLCIFTASTVYGTINEGLGEKVTNFNVDGSDMTL